MLKKHTFRPQKYLFRGKSTLLGLKKAFCYELQPNLYRPHQKGFRKFREVVQKFLKCYKNILLGLKSTSSGVKSTLLGLKKAFCYELQPNLYRPHQKGFR